MNKYIVLILFVFLSEAFVSQKSIVICDQNKQPVEFCNVSTTSKIKGHYTNKNGFVEMSEFSLNDTLIISCLGYKLSKYVFSEIQDTVFLVRKNIALPVFEIKSNYSYQKLGYKKGRKIGVYSGPEVEGLISGRIINSRQKGLIESVEFFIKKSNDNPNCKYALRIYQIDTITKLPKNEVLDTILFIQTNKKGWSKIELSEYYIKYKGSIFVGVECFPNFFMTSKDAKNNYDANVTLGLAKNLEYDVFCVGRNGIKWHKLSNEDTGGTSIIPMIRATIKY